VVSLHKTPHFWSFARLHGRDIREIVRLAEYIGREEPEHDGGVFRERKSFVKPEDVPVEFLTALHVVPPKHWLAGTVNSKVTYVDDLSWRNRKCPTHRLRVLDEGRPIAVSMPDVSDGSRDFDVELAYPVFAGLNEQRVRLKGIPDQ
jgi:hypothetical protein